jgi:hypothetical protein
MVGFLRIHNSAVLVCLVILDVDSLMHCAGVWVHDVE